jgi:hypothetical protein
LREWFAMLTTCDALVQGRFNNWAVMDWSIKNPISLTMWLTASNFLTLKAVARSQGPECDKSTGESADLVSVCPFPLSVGGGDSWSTSNVAVCQQQKFYGHPVGERVMSE